MRELRDIHNVENEMMRLVDHCVGYTAILAAETLEAADHMDKGCDMSTSGSGGQVTCAVVNHKSQSSRL